MISMNVSFIQVLIRIRMFFDRRLIFLPLRAAFMFLITLEVFAYLFLIRTFTPRGNVFGGRPGLPFRNASAQKAKRVLP
jgi:uncharacterized membrane protein